MWIHSGFCSNALPWGCWQCWLSLCVSPWNSSFSCSFPSHSDKDRVCRAVWRSMFWALREQLLPSGVRRRLLRPQGHRLLRTSNCTQPLYISPSLSHVSDPGPCLGVSWTSPSFVQCLFLIFSLKLFRFVCRLIVLQGRKTLLSNLLIRCSN